MANRHKSVHSDATPSWLRQIDYMGACMKKNWNRSRSAIPVALSALLLFSLPISAYAAPSFGNCKVLFVGQKAPVSPGATVTPLCAEDTDAVFFATGYSKQDNHGAWSAY